MNVAFTEAAGRHRPQRAAEVQNQGVRFGASAGTQQLQAVWQIHVGQRVRPEEESVANPLIDSSADN